MRRHDQIHTILRQSAEIDIWRIGFDVDSNAVTIVGPAGAETLPLQSKARVARKSAAVARRLPS